MSQTCLPIKVFLRLGILAATGCLGSVSTSIPDSSDDVGPSDGSAHLRSTISSPDLRTSDGLSLEHFESKQQANSASPLMMKHAIARGHSSDHSWLAGELSFSSVRNCWRLRYAGFEDDDRYGGCVTLVELPQTFVPKEGERVLVLGKMLETKPMRPSPEYRVRLVKALQP